MSGPINAQSFNADDSTVVSFETIGNALGQVDIGVGVIGNRCGVHGESHDATLGTRVVPDSTGVHGRGQANGVVGEGVVGRGVFGIVAPPDSGGTTGENATGVLGEGFDNSFGVVGLCFSGVSENDLDFGTSIGVLGVSNGDSDRTLSSNPADPRTLGAGVVGMSVTRNTQGFEGGHVIPNITEVDGDGTGVWGVSRGGRGVHGESDSGRGGVFESRTSSQLQLVPTARSIGPQRRTVPTLTSSQLPELPRDGEAGDLIATLQLEPDGNGGTSSQARLWFCVRSVDPKTNRAAGWAQVLLGDTFDGG
jgi:hypothetical protein